MSSVMVVIFDRSLHAENVVQVYGSSGHVTSSILKPALQNCPVMY